MLQQKISCTNKSTQNYFGQVNCHDRNSFLALQLLIWMDDCGINMSKDVGLQYQQLTCVGKWEKQMLQIFLFSKLTNICSEYILVTVFRKFTFSDILEKLRWNMISSKPSSLFRKKICVSQIFDTIRLFLKQKEWTFANYLHRIIWKILRGPYKICLMILYCIEKENFIICEAKLKGKHRLSICEMFLKQKSNPTKKWEK